MQFCVWQIQIIHSVMYKDSLFQESQTSCIAAPRSCSPVHLSSVHLVPSAGSLKAGQRRFFSVALRFLCGALDSDSGTGLVQVSAGWEASWNEVAVLWRLCIQALGGCVRARPETAALVREVGWLRHALATLAGSSALPDPLTEEVLEEALCAMAEQCLVCRQEIRDAVIRSTGGALNRMKTLEENLNQSS